MHHLRVRRFGIGGKYVFAAGGEQCLCMGVGQQLRMLVFDLREVVFDLSELTQQVTLRYQ